MGFRAPRTSFNCDFVNLLALPYVMKSHDIHSSAREARAPLQYWNLPETLGHLSAHDAFLGGALQQKSLSFAR